MIEFLNSSLKSNSNQIQLLIVRALLQFLRHQSSEVSSAPRLNSDNPTSFDSLISDAAKRYQLDPALVKAVVHTESNFDPQAVSRSGAQGLMQLMPATAASLGVEDSLDPADNVDGGARYLRQMLNRYDQNVSLALAAYNAGPGAVDRYGAVPPYAETQRYVPRALALYKTYQVEV